PTHGWEGTSAREYRSSFRPTVSLLRGAFGMRGRVRIWEDDGASVDSRHRRDDLLVECFGDRAHTDDRRRLERLDGLDKIPYRRVRMSIGFLEIGEIRAG